MNYPKYQRRQRAKGINRAARAKVKNTPTEPVSVDIPEKVKIGQTSDGTPIYKPRDLHERRKMVAEKKRKSIEKATPGEAEKKSKVKTP